MARVRVTIEYDLDHDGVPTADELAQERRDWLEGKVELADIMAVDDMFTPSAVGIVLITEGIGDASSD